MNHLASAERDWLLNALRESPAAAVRSLPIAAIPAVVAALLALPDPIAFVHIAGGARAVPPALCDWIATIPASQAPAGAITALHAARKRMRFSMHCRMTCAPPCAPTLTFQGVA